MSNKFLETMGNISETENGAFGYKSTFDPMVDFSFRLASYRGASQEKIEEDFAKILDSKDEDVLRFLFYIRDVRDGLGERRTFKICLKKFIASDFDDKEKIIEHLCNYIMEYGRADDLFCLLDDDVDAPIRNVVYRFIRNTLIHDEIALVKKESISLLAKWLPSENASSKKTKELATKIRKNIGLSPKAYRKALSSLRKGLKIVERDMSANDWDKIDYNSVPSRANLNYKNAFLKHDEERRKQYLSDLVNGVRGVKMNSSVNFPYDIVHKYSEELELGHWNRKASSSKEDETLEMAWKNLKDIPGLDNCLVVADDSGSMLEEISSTSKVSALDVARSIAIYGAQHLRSDYNGKIVTFSRTPKFLDISQKKNLKDILEYLDEHSEVANTNVEAVFDLILKVAVSKNLKQEDLPGTLVIISDMEFDYGVRDFDNSMLGAFNNPVEAAREKFEKNGYKLPKLVFWNVASRTGTIPIEQNDLGFLLISGFSQNLFNGIAAGKLDTREMLNEVLTSERYSKIEKIIFEKDVDKED